MWPTTWHIPSSTSGRRFRNPAMPIDPHVERARCQNGVVSRSSFCFWYRLKHVSSLIYVQRFIKMLVIPFWFPKIRKRGAW
jgi:hypothetical protein